VGRWARFFTDSKFGLKKPFRLVDQVQLESTNIKVQFSPTSPTLPWKQSSNGLIGKTLNSAIESVDLALFVFSDQGIANIWKQIINKVSKFEL
jgi:hypothetical protein